MTRINTNISSLTAQNTLAKSNNQLQLALTRLSTGLRINSGKDDPAGLIASAALGSQIKSTSQAIGNSQAANQMISTADSALGQISALLVDVRGLVTQAASTAGMSAAQIAANQLQVDSSLEAIDRISQTTTFQGNRLLDGSLGFLVSGGSNFDQVTDLQVNQVSMGSASQVSVSVKVTAAATQATITDSLTSGTQASATFALGTGSITIKAPTGGTEYNGTSLQIQRSASVAAGTAVASYDAGTNVLTVTVNTAGNTNNTTIAAAIEANTDFTIDSANPPSGVYASGVDPESTLSEMTATTTDGGVLQINAKDPNSTWDGTTIQWDTTGTSLTPQLSWTGSPGSGTLTIQVHSSTPTSLQDIADAINNSTDEDIQQFAASVTTAGFVDPAFDGESTAAGAASAATYDVGAATVTVTANDNGEAADGLTVEITVGGASTTAVYDSTGNGTLTINLAASTTISAAALQTALDNLTGANDPSEVVAFQAMYTTTATGRAVVTGAAAIADTDSSATVEDQQGTDDPGGQPEIAHADVTDGVKTLTLTLTGTANATADRGVQIVIEEAAAGTATTTAVYDDTANGGAGQLNIYLGHGQTITQATIDAAIGAMTNNATFVARYTHSYAWAGVGANELHTAVTTLADQTTAGGANDILGLGGTFAGGGISATFAGGTGTAALSGDLVVQIGSDIGKQMFKFIAGTTAAEMVVAINQVSESTGVIASIDTGGDLELKSTNYGTDAYVDVNVVSDEGTFADNLSGTHANGTDVAATVNNMAATGKGNVVSVNTPNLAFAATLSPGVAASTVVAFTIDGGGALFQLGPEVVTTQQARLGIQSVDSGNLGGASGRLYQLASGGDAALAVNPALASKILDEAASQVTSLRGRLGAFQKSTVDSNIATLTDAVTNLTAAKSSIEDADFAAESANLTRAQILVQSGTTVLAIANKNPENVLALLR
jgi:flagellin